MRALLLALAVLVALCLPSYGLSENEHNEESARVSADAGYLYYCKQIHESRCIAALDAIAILRGSRGAASDIYIYALLHGETMLAVTVYRLRMELDATLIYIETRFEAGDYPLPEPEHSSFDPTAWSDLFFTSRVRRSCIH